MYVSTFIVPLKRHQLHGFRAVSIYDVTLLFVFSICEYCIRLGLKVGRGLGERPGIPSRHRPTTPPPELLTNSQHTTSPNHAAPAAVLLRTTRDPRHRHAHRVAWYAFAPHQVDMYSLLRWSHDPMGPQAQGEYFLGALDPDGDGHRGRLVHDVDGRQCRGGGGNADACDVLGGLRVPHVSERPNSDRAVLKRRAEIV